jgi:hypothetical protein
VREVDALARGGGRQGAADGAAVAAVGAGVVRSLGVAFCLDLDAARLWGVDPDATRCELTADMLERSRPVARVLAAEGELPAPWVPRGAVTRGQVLHWLAHQRGPWLPA